MGPTWGQQDPSEPHVGHVNLAIWTVLAKYSDAFAENDRYMEKDCLYNLLEHQWRYWNLTQRGDMTHIWSMIYAK